MSWANGSVNVMDLFHLTDNGLLMQQINASSSPYEGEDDFFTRHSQDDINFTEAIASRRFSGVHGCAGRPRGKSESVNSNAGSRPPSSLDV